MFRIVAASALLCLVAAGSAWSEDQPTDTPAKWLKKPTAGELLSVWPRASIHTSGRAVLVCLVSGRGVVFNCSVDSEEPEGSGFGQAALALTPQFLMKPAMKGGEPVISRFRFRIEFSRETGQGAFANPQPLHAIVANPVWFEAPSQQDVAAAYPPKAAARRLGGRVTLVCTLDKAAVPRRCDTVKEEPRNARFGRAALSLAGQFKGPATFADGKSTKGVYVQMMFSFTPEMLDGKTTASGPFWLETPSAAELLALLPNSASKAGVKNVSVIMNCLIAPGGRLDPCVVESEEPGGYEIGKALLPVSSKFRLSPWSQDGMPVVGGRIRVPIRYVIEDDGAKASLKP